MGEGYQTRDHFRDELERDLRITVLFNGKYNMKSSSMILPR